MEAMAAPKNPRKKPTKDDEPGVLFIRNVPADVMVALDARVKELQESSSLYAGLSRSSLALDLIKKGLDKRPAK